VSDGWLYRVGVVHRGEHIAYSCERLDLGKARVIVGETWNQDGDVPRCLHIWTIEASGTRPPIILTGEEDQPGAGRGPNRVELVGRAAAKLSGWPLSEGWVAGRLR
jgi:hypothetical protein